MIGLIVLVALVIAVIRWRGRRRKMLAGLVSSKPTFAVEPPRRHLSNLKGQRL